MSCDGGIYNLTSNISSPQNSTLGYCLKHRYWPIYVASILGTFFGGLFLILIYHGIVKLLICCSNRKAEHDAYSSSSSSFPDATPIPNGDFAVFSRDDHGNAGHKPVALQCTQTEATMWPSEVEMCGEKGLTLRTIDFAFNIFFLLHFLVRFAAAENKLSFWVDWFSILDYCTVPPTIIAFALQRSWMGLRFARIFRLFNLAEVLHNLNLIKSSYGLRLCQLSSLFIAIWLSSAGMFYLLENTGDPFGEDPYGNAVTLTYTDC
ncbi:unnamed protein product, partial [Dibothriocephalus latus]